MTHTILIVDDEPRYRKLYEQVLTPLNVRVLQAQHVDEALAQIAGNDVDLIVSDVRMPGKSGIELLQEVRRTSPSLPFLLVTAYAEVREAVSALKLGAVDYLSKPLDLDELVICVVEALGLSTHSAATEELPDDAFEGIIAECEVMRDLFREAWHVAQSDVNVLLTGESGTGKEVLARFIHRHSTRVGAPCVALNCAALPADLLPAELFGHERGAFTGATHARKGRFREAEGGVLFLDEIGDMPLGLQPTFLRALEQRCVTPVGGSMEIPVDFRLIAATHHVLKEDVEKGRFRADLFYRLNVVELQIPPLRERPDDILPLARHFLARRGHHTKRIARATATQLKSYPWPGNIRELENAMARAGLLTRSDVILPENLPPGLRQSSPTEPVHTRSTIQGQMLTLQESEVESLRHALDLTEGNRTRAAEMLGITRRGLLKKIKRLGL